MKQVQYFLSYNKFFQSPQFRMKTKQLDLDHIIYSLYGNSLKKYKNIKTAYSIFTPYQNIETEQILYFYLFKVESNSHLSEGTINYALKKYNPFLSKVQFLLIQRNFDTTSYLIKSYKCLISFDEMISLKKECQQIMQKEQILKMIEFIISIYKQKKCIEFPQLTPKSIGINQEGQLKLCDYSFYFKKNFQMRSLTENICSCINPMIKIALLKSSSRFIPSDNEYYRLKQYYGENFSNLIKILVLDPMQNMQKEGVLNGKSKQCNIQKIQEVLTNYDKNITDDLDTTLNQTFQEDFKIKQYNQSDLITKDSIKQPFLDQQIVKTTKKTKKVLISAILIMFLLLGLAVYFFFKYHSNQITCDVGTYKAIDSNQCLSCSDGCLRCQTGQKTACYSCSAKMFLVLNDQHDTIGACQSTCVSGVILRSNLCLKKKISIN